MRHCFGNALHWFQSLTASANHEVNTWIRNMTFAASTPVLENSLETDNMEGTMRGNTQLQGVPVEDKGHSCLPVCPQCVTNTAESPLNCLGTPGQNGDTQFHIANC